MAGSRQSNVCWMYFGSFSGSKTCTLNNSLNIGSSSLFLTWKTANKLQVLQNSQQIAVQDICIAHILISCRYHVFNKQFVIYCTRREQYNIEHMDEYLLDNR
ncbi:Hypothetical_protein [Hexamita inflata]|uniref:Hypothetical_protein n=1 Tax=Hexamita inflata TaxID=28002 RepID=A0AA86QGJ1_9EUKA|nr:Hypothetical protein HINF_LOCUS46491 [Hexamita inflata]